MLSLQTLVTLVQNMAAAAQSAASTALDFTIGSVERALVEAVAGVQLWLQYLVLAVLQQAFLSSCTGSQVDAWFANNFPMFGGRLLGTYATGSVTFSRFTATSSALVLVGSLVRTADGTQSFAVVVDTTNPLYVSASNGYLIPAGVTAATIAVEAVAIGAGGNVAENTISQIVGSVPYVDTVNNASAFTDGEPQETDAAVKLRFQNWQETRASGTYAAVEYAVQSVQTNLTYTVTPNAVVGGTYTPGSFVVAIDDGSGATPTATVTAVSNAVALVRPIGSTAYVVAATPLTVTVGMTLTVAIGYSTSAAQAAVGAAVLAYIDGLPVGATMPYTILAKLAYDAFIGVSNVTGITLNGATADIVPTTSQVCRAGVITINP
ncbi:MAG: baseplate J/gp47 family protein [Acidobacteriaceae bacterium]|nr:baseplate J/gp47 family protein [Acidobacteriaceae bacterium]